MEKLSIIDNISDGGFGILRKLFHNGFTVDRKESASTYVMEQDLGINRTTFRKQIDTSAFHLLLKDTPITEDNIVNNWTKYAVTELGEFLLVKKILRDTSDQDEFESAIQKSKDTYDLISKYWDGDLSELSNFRFKCFSQAISSVNLNIISENNLPFDIVSVELLLYVQNPNKPSFIHLENLYPFYLNEKQTVSNPNLLELYRKITDKFPLELNFASKEIIKNEFSQRIELDIKNFVTYAFYYYALLETEHFETSIKKLKKSLDKKPKKKDGVKVKEISKITSDQVMTRVIELGKELQDLFGENIDFSSDSLEQDIIEKTKYSHQVVVNTIKKNKIIPKKLHEVNELIQTQTKTYPRDFERLIK